MGQMSFLLSPIHTADADATQLSSWVMSAVWTQYAPVGSQTQFTISCAVELLTSLLKKLSISIKIHTVKLLWSLTISFQIVDGIRLYGIRRRELVSNSCTHRRRRRDLTRRLSRVASAACIGYYPANSTSALRITNIQAIIQTPEIKWQAATDSVKVVDGYLMPMTITEQNAWQWERSDASHISAKREWELNVTFDQLQRHEVMLLIVASIVEQHAIPLLRRKATTHAAVFIKRPKAIYQSINQSIGHL